MTKFSKKIDASDVPPANDGFLGSVDVDFLFHELKDPLSLIETSVRMLLEKTDKYGPLTDRQAKALKRTLKYSKKARSLVGELLEVGRSDAGCFQCQRFDAVVTLNDLIVEAVETSDPKLWESLQAADSEANRTALLNRNGISLNLPIGVRDFQLCQDEVKFRQILGNLIKNALQYRSRALTISMECRDEKLVVEVSDDGPGIEPDHQEVIFNRYTRLAARTQTSRPGHGLGLAGARILARHLGGDITVRNNHGAGAVFCLFLPMTLKA